MNSITARLFIVASLVLATFVVFTSLAVRHSVHERAADALYSKMQGMVYGILGSAELEDNRQLVVNELQLPDQRLLSPVSGIYAEVRDEGSNIVWNSASTVTSIPAIKSANINDWHFLHRDPGSSEEVRAVQFKVAYVAENGDEPAFTIQVAEDAAVLAENLARFDRNLWMTLLLAALALLLVLAAVLAWGLRPLHAIGKDLRRIEAGDSTQLETEVPRELEPLASSINTLLASERNRQLRYRNVMEDLAHSLKTPLSVLKNTSQQTDTLESGELDQIHQQTARMQDIVNYHLQRAQAGGVQALAAPLNPLPIVQRLTESLKKIYSRQVLSNTETNSGRSIEFHTDIADTFRLRINESDLFEILGNLLDNACKYGASTISIIATTKDKEVCLQVVDDGPGFPEQGLRQMLQRGQRADSRIEGQGLGLAVSSELVESFGGKLTLANRDEGGAIVSLSFPL